MTTVSIQSTTATVTLEETDMPKKEGATDLTVTRTITLLKCPKCGHEWEPRTAEPRQCPGYNFRLHTLRTQNKETK